MAFIPVSSPYNAVAAVPAVALALTTNNQLNYKQGGRQVLILENSGDAPVTVVIKGSKAASVNLQRIGETKSLVAGFSVILAATSKQHLALINIAEYLKGAITITGGTADTKAIVLEA